MYRIFPKMIYLLEVSYTLSPQEEYDNAIIGICLVALQLVLSYKLKLLFSSEK